MKKKNLLIVKIRKSSFLFIESVVYLELSMRLF